MGIAFYLQEGIWHILDFNALDHMLFVVTLCCVYAFKDYKKVLILLTAFTIGHSVTLILSGLGLLNFPQNLIETLIPCTIIIAALSNFFLFDKSKGNHRLKYASAVFFGLIHGAGFSNYFRMMLADIEDNVLKPLVMFNVGIELGQIVILLCYFAALFVLLKLFKSTQYNVAKVISGIAIYESLRILFL